MTDWNQVEKLKAKKMEILQDTDLSGDLRLKLARVIELQIQQEFEVTTRCTLQDDTVIRMQPLEFEIWE